MGWLAGSFYARHGDSTVVGSSDRDRLLREFVLLLEIDHLRLAVSPAAPAGLPGPGRTAPRVALCNIMAAAAALMAGASDFSRIITSSGIVTVS